MMAHRLLLTISSIGREKFFETETDNDLPAFNYDRRTLECSRNNYLTECETAQTINIETLIDEFAVKKTRRIEFQS